MVSANKNDPSLIYADLYANYKIVGTPYLAYRDLPSILNKYVKGKVALDYGSGSGESTLFLKSLDFKVSSVDINERMIDIARKKDPLGEYHIISSGELPFESASFDLVFCSFVLLEIAKKEEILKVIREVVRVLKPDGVFISIAASDYTYSHNWLSLNTDFPENKNIVSGSKVKIELKDLNLTINDYFWTENDYVDLFTLGGLKLMEIHNPLGKETDGYEWKDEKFVSPCSVIVNRRL